MERDLKVLLIVDDNSYKITIKTRGLVNAVPFSEFKLFIDDKHKQLFHNTNYVWKIYDPDFGQYVSLENNSLIYDMSKIKACKEDIRLQGNINTGNIRPQNYPPQPMNYITQSSQRELLPSENQLRKNIQDLREFVNRFSSPQINPAVNSTEANTFDSYYPSRMPDVANVTPNRTPMGPSFIPRESPRDMGYRRISPPPLISNDMHYMSPNNFNSPSNYPTNVNRMPMPLTPYPHLSRRRDKEMESESPIYLMSQSLHDSYSHSKRYKSPEPSRSSSNRNRVLSTPLYLKRMAERRKSPSRPVPKLMKPSSPIRERSRKLTEASKKLLRQHLTASPSKRKLPNVKASTSKEVESLSQTIKPVPNCIRLLHAKVRDYFRIEDRRMGKAVINAVKKYNDEFKTLAMFEDIWETDRIWNYVAKEVISSSPDIRVKQNRRAVRCRRYFRGMFRRYLIILEDFWNWSEYEAQELWPFFEFFHKELDLTPFDKDILKLKECFIKKVKPMKENKESKSKADSESKSSKMKPENKDFVFDDKYDVRLLMAVSEHIEDFKKETILESDVWTEVAVDLNDPPILDPTLLEKSRIKWETRFYKLLSEFQSLSKKSSPLKNNERTLKFLFDKLDVSPFIKEENESGDESDASEELDREMLVVSDEVVTLDEEAENSQAEKSTKEEEIESLMKMIDESKDKSGSENESKEEIMEVDEEASVRNDLNIENDKNENRTENEVKDSSVCENASEMEMEKENPTQTEDINISVYKDKSAVNDKNESMTESEVKDSSVCENASEIEMEKENPTQTEDINISVCKDTSAANDEKENSLQDETRLKPEDVSITNGDKEKTKRRETNDQQVNKEVKNNLSTVDADINSSVSQIESSIKIENDEQEAYERSEVEEWLLDVNDSDVKPSDESDDISEANVGFEGSSQLIEDKDVSGGVKKSVTEEMHERSVVKECEEPEAELITPD